MLPSEKRPSVWWRDTFIGVLGIAIIGAVLFFFIQLGILDPIFKPQSQPQAEPAPASSPASEPEAEPASQPVATPSGVYVSPAPVAASPEPSSTPPPLDDKTIIEARIERTSKIGNIAPGVVAESANPSFNTVVVTEAGILGLGDECYVHWTVQNNDQTLSTRDGRCAPESGVGAAFWPRVDYEPGTVRVTADVTVVGGDSRSLEYVYEVR